MLKQRILTSLILAPLALLLVFYVPLHWFTYCAAGVALLGAWEWSALMGICQRAKRFVFVLVVAAIIAVMEYHFPIDALWQQGQLITQASYVFLAAFVWWLIATVLVVAYPRLTSGWANNLVVSAVAGILTLVPLWLALNTLRSVQYDTSTTFGSFLILAVLGIVWSADIGAFFAGKNLGRHKLMPKVSPNKTIEGLAGGVLCAVLFTVIFCYFYGVPSSQWLVYGLVTALIAVFSAVGDLLESMFKRQAGMKDSGRCLPGHGGILDRIDSLTAAAPIFALCYAWALTL